MGIDPETLIVSLLMSYAAVPVATEKLSVEEISRRLLLEHLLWQESERNLVESVRFFSPAAKTAP